MQSENSATQLLLIIEGGKKIKRSENCSIAWATLLRVQAADHSQLMTGLGKVMALPSQVLESLKEHAPSVYKGGSAATHFYSCINAGFNNQLLQSTWSTFIDHIDDHAISNLRLISELISAISPRKAISESETLEIRAQAEALINFVLESKFTPELKAFLIGKLKAVIDALDSYYITGSAPVLDALAATLGHAYLNPEYRSAIKDTDDGAGFASRLANLANAVTVATAAAQVGAASVPLLEFAAKAIPAF